MDSPGFWSGSVSILRFLPPQGWRFYDLLKHSLEVAPTLRLFRFLLFFFLGIVFVL
jgi:hypothetical protein